MTEADNTLAVQLEALRSRCSSIVKALSRKFPDDAERYGAYFDELNELIDKEFEIKIVV